ncbi:MAG: hypothetical protein Q9162_004730 [Coniocarpon cinnabarinum]
MSSGEEQPKAQQRSSSIPASLRSKESPLSRVSPNPIFTAALRDPSLRCALRPWRFSDVPKLALAMTEDMNRGYSSRVIKHSDRVRHAWGWVWNGLKEAEFGTTGSGEKVPLAYAITLLEDKDGVLLEHVLGEIEIGMDSREEHATFPSATLSYLIGKEWWNKGVMTAAAKGFVGWVFENFPDIERVEGFVAADWAPASERVLEKTGFRKYGKSRKIGWKEDLGWSGGSSWELLRSEWHEQSEEAARKVLVVTG